MDPLCHRPIGFGHDCASFHIQFYISSLNSGSIDIMDHSFRIEFQAARASVERHGPQPVFQLPWEKGIWRRIFNPSPTPLAVISRSSLFHLHFQVLPIFNSTTCSTLTPMLILIPIHLSSLAFRLPSLIFIPLTLSSLRIFLQLNLQRNSGRNSLDTLTCKKDVQMVYVISLFQGSFQCWLLQQDHRCFYLRQTLGIFMLVSALPCR